MSFGRLPVAIACVELGTAKPIASVRDRIKDIAPGVLVAGIAKATDLA